jgi:hypothetical protein
MKQIYFIQIECCYNGEHVVDVHSEAFNDLASANSTMLQILFSDLRDSWLNQYKPTELSISQGSVVNELVIGFYINTSDDNYYYITINDMNLL